MEITQRTDPHPGDAVTHNFYDSTHQACALTQSPYDSTHHSNALTQGPNDSTHPGWCPETPSGEEIRSLTADFFDF
ncbi:hypothetical protein [Bhargavaea ullalensis]|uniref:hypothetical protein n=1 Tax=Bhargavaea ullalensis TaxID=1265685 RepID=UPI003397E8E9